MTSDRDGQYGSGRDESHKERVDRELIELLNELRVALPGVQVLFAFLLTLPFTTRFDVLSQDDRRVYFAAVLFTAASSALLIAPSAHHRLQFRSGSKERLLVVANNLAIGGMVFLALGMGSAVYVVSAVLHEGSWPGVVGGTVAGVIALLWFALPLTYPDGEDVAADDHDRSDDEPSFAGRR